MSDRTAQLQKMLQQQPNDPFLVYAMAMEDKKTDAAKALAGFNRTIELDPGYCYAYFQLGQTLESTGDVAGARSAYERGIAAAEKKGDAHARSEIAGAMEVL